MDTFIEIMTYSVLILIGLSALSGGLVALAAWLVDNSPEPHGH